MSNIVQSIFSYTGADQTYTVQPGVTSITVKMWGAGGGGNGTGKGGGGAYVEGTLTVTPGETLTVIVGSGGSRYNTANNYGGGGGSATVRGQGAQGGGRSALRRGATEVVTAGGGGGGGGDGSGLCGGAATVDSQSFAGDVTAGTQVQSRLAQPRPGIPGSTDGSGGGGSSTAGGVNGTWPNNRGSAAQFQGGTGGGDAGSGGGGGGWWGGGGGGFSGGGGAGSSYLVNLTNTSNSQSAAREVPGNNSSSLRGTAGLGGTNVAGGDGLVILESPFTQPTEQLRYQNRFPIPPSQQGSPVIYNYTGNYQTYTVPANANYVLVFLWGAGGGNASTRGGGAAYVTGMLPVTPNETLRLIVGAGGNRSISSDATGGNGIGSRAYGGGRSAIQRSNTDIVVAGAGGGGAGSDAAVPSGGGGNATWSGISFTGSSGSFTQFRQIANNAQSGGGGGQSSGGFAANGSSTGVNAGSKGQGGTSINNASGGGGGGWYGGGGGAQSPPNHGTGGAGSSYIDLLLSASGADASLGQTGFQGLFWTNPIGCSNGDGRIVLVPVIPTTIPLQLSLNNLVPVVQRVAFLGTGAIQTFTVPPGVFSFRFFLWGAGGIGQNGNINSTAAASGAYVEGNLPTSPGTTYSIIVGRPGQTGLANGGGTTGGTSAGGGGFSGIFSASPAANTVIAIAGGGGGSGFNGGGNGGAGGFPNGFSGSGSQSQGGGGTQTAGGASSATPGSQLAGGNGGGGDQGGGGGGGGWYGGGGGRNQGAGGGGSSTYISSVINPVTFNGTNGGGAISPTPAANRSSPHWISPFGSGGQNGLVVIGYSQQPITLVGFSYTGSYITYTVPTGVTTYFVYMWGAGGSGNNQGVNGGAGAFLSGIFSVTPGETLRLVVGKGGIAAGQNATDAQGGGGSSLGSANSAQGGGRSAIQRDIGGTFTEVVTVGGGGGAGYYGRNGGAGSYTTQGRRGFDQAYTTTFLNANPSAGGGGGPTSGGQGAYGKTASDGTQFRGGDVILSFGNPNGGGGGGGWYGGGGGSGGTPGEGSPGGGGSSYIANLTSVSGEDSAGQPAPGTSSPIYPGGTVAAGGISNTQAGGNGYIALVPLLGPRSFSLRFQPTPVVAFGGIVIQTAQYRYHVFQSSGLFSIGNTVPNYTLNYLVVGGGGGGGDRHGGGGGAGGVLSGTFIARPATYTVTVGEGGAGGNHESSPLTLPGAGRQGGNSSILGVATAFGGGGGGTYDGILSGTYGSGGGGGGGSSTTGTAGTAGQGFAGGNGLNPAGGGGGGAGGVGANANTSTGGIGTAAFSSHLLAVGYGSTFATSPQSPISGGVAYIAGGGGGGANSSTAPTARAGGLGGGGTGDWDNAVITAGTANTGGGGGGCRSNVEPSNGRNGGSGLVMIWYSV
jgi:hypothetical protein